MPLADHIPQLDDRSYDSIVAEMRSRIARYTPEWQPVWTDVNDSDPGITMLQVFAWLGEMLAYRMNRVPELNYLKFLQLLGIELRPKEPAQAEITFPVRAAHPEPTVDRSEGNADHRRERRRWPAPRLRGDACTGVPQRAARGADRARRLLLRTRHRSQRRRDDGLPPARPDRQRRLGVDVRFRQPVAVPRHRSHAVRVERRAGAARPTRRMRSPDERRVRAGHAALGVLERVRMGVARADEGRHARVHAHGRDRLAHPAERARDHDRPTRHDSAVLDPRPRRDESVRAAAAPARGRAQHDDARPGGDGAVRGARRQHRPARPGVRDRQRSSAHGQPPARDRPGFRLRGVDAKFPTSSDRDRTTSTTRSTAVPARSASATGSTVQSPSRTPPIRARTSLRPSTATAAARTAMCPPAR